MTKTPEEMLHDLPPDWWQQARAIEELLKWFKKISYWSPGWWTS
jgi:hypothetical protein